MVLCILGLEAPRGYFFFFWEGYVRTLSAVRLVISVNLASPSCLWSHDSWYHYASTHLPLAPHTCVVNRVSIGSNNGLSPIRRQAIIWTNTGLLSIGPIGTNFGEILIKPFSFKKMRSKMSYVKMAAILPKGRWVNLLSTSCLWSHNLWYHYALNPPQQASSGMASAWLVFLQWIIWTRHNKS